MNKVDDCVDAACTTGRTQRSYQSFTGLGPLREFRNCRLPFPVVREPEFTTQAGSNEITVRTLDQTHLEQSAVADSARQTGGT